MTSAASDTREILAEAVEQLVSSLVRLPRLPGDSEPAELSTFQAIALTTLVDEGPLRLGALAATLGTTDATASRTVDTLERLELAERLPDTSDGRVTVVHATSDGVESVQARRERLEQLVARLVERLGPTDGARLAVLLTELRDVLR